MIEAEFTATVGFSCRRLARLHETSTFLERNVLVKEVKLRVCTDESWWLLHKFVHCALQTF